MGFEATDKELEDASLLEPTGCRSGEHSLDVTASAVTVGAEGSLAPQHGGAKHSLGVVVRGFEIVVLGKVPQRRFQAEQVLAEDQDLLHAQFDTTFEHASKLRLERAQTLLQCAPVDDVGFEVPPEQKTCLVPSSASSPIFPAFPPRSATRLKSRFRCAQQTWRLRVLIDA